MTVLENYLITPFVQQLLITANKVPFTSTISSAELQTAMQLRS